MDVISRRTLAFICRGLLLYLVGILVGCSAQSPTADAGRQVMPSSEAALPFNIADQGGLNRERYAHIDENEFLTALNQPQSTFSVDVDTAAYANVRRMLNEGRMPDVGAVRIEELVNYFDYDYPEPQSDHPFSVSTEYAHCPWNSEHGLVRIGLKGKSIDMEDRPACNLVFLLDVSGSMMAANKLPLVQSAMKLLVGQLNAQDRIAIVVYAGASGVVLDSTACSDGSTILAAVDALEAGGSTNASAGINSAYAIAEEHFIHNGINRVILCTDGDFNVGTTSDSELVRLIKERAAGGIDLSVLGFGTGNLNDATIEKLADNGNGNYAYIDSLLEARKVLVEEVGGTLVTIAKDVKIQVDFNPLHVRSYRLLGYENRVMENRDFRDDSKDAGEIGAGHCVTAFYEVVPEADGRRVPNEGERKSEFVTPTLPPEADQDTLLTVNLRYKLPGSQAATEFQSRLSADSLSGSPSVDFQFATAVLAYGMLLRESRYAGDANWGWIIETAGGSVGDDPRGLRAEFLELAKTARRLGG